VIFSRKRGAEVYSLKNLDLTALLSGGWPFLSREDIFDRPFLRSRLSAQLLPWDAARNLSRAGVHEDVAMEITGHQAGACMTLPDR
jgi:hypothetical protein